MTQLDERIVRPLVEWYQKERRILPWREDPTPYHVWVSEIMLQQTRVEAVVDYYLRFLGRFPDINTLAEASVDEVRTYWQGLGYYRRCEMMHKAAQILVKEHNGVIPDNYEQILALPGIGRYTASAMMSIGFLKPYPAVDGNVMRVIMRLLRCYDCIDEERVRSEVERELKQIAPEKQASAFTQGLMELGATVCLPNGKPLCSRCPWQDFCLGQKEYAEIPVRKQKKSRKIETKTVFVLNRQDKIALKKRPEKGLLAGMWELPNVNGVLSESEIEELYGGDISLIGDVKHIFTHVEWHMRWIRVLLKEMPDDETLCFVKKSGIADYAIPSAFQYFKTEW